MIGLENDSVPCTRRSTARQHMDRSSERYSKRERQAKRYQENIQNTEKSMVVSES